MNRAVDSLAYTSICRHVTVVAETVADDDGDSSWRYWAAQRACSLVRGCGSASTVHPSSPQAFKS